MTRSKSVVGVLVAVAALAALALPSLASAAELSRAERRAITRVLNRFVPAAVRRENPLAAYGLVTPVLRTAATRAEWARGDIPVYPYPAAGRRFGAWRLEYVLRDKVGIELILLPRRGEKIGPIAFAVDLKRIRRRWLVDNFMPAATFAAPGEPARVLAPVDFGPGSSSGGGFSSEPRIDGAWVALPLAVLGLGPIVALAALLAVGLRGRRARPPQTALPPLPASRRPAT